MDPAGKKWIIDILDGKAEQERTLFSDPDPENGFILSSSWGYSIAYSIFSAALNFDN